MKNKSFYLLFLRYIIILIAGLGNLFIFYEIFTPITVYLSTLILNILSPGTVSIASTIVFKDLLIEIVPACVAGAAYYFLFILCMSIPIKPLSRRIKIIIFSLGVFLIFNVTRIIIFATIADTKYFEATHFFFWYFLSTVLVVSIWFLTVYTFKIKEIPVYTDVKELFNKTKKAKGKTKHNKSSN